MWFMALAVIAAMRSGSFGFFNQSVKELTRFLCLHAGLKAFLAYLLINVYFK